MDELDPYFEGETRAAEWRAMRQALAGRLRSLRESLRETSSETDRAKIEREIEAVEKQIQALSIEEVAQQFVEDSVRVTLAQQALEEEAEEN